MRMDHVCSPALQELVVGISTVQLGMAHPEIYIPGSLVHCTGRFIIVEHANIYVVSID